MLRIYIFTNTPKLFSLIRNIFNFKITFNSKFVNNKYALSYYTKENLHFIKYSLYILFDGFSLCIIFIEYSVFRMFIDEVLRYTGLIFSFIYDYIYFSYKNVTMRINSTIHA